METILQRAREQFPGERPRIISDNGPQFIARDFKEFIRICGMTHVRTSPYYPQSNGKMERWFKTLKGECIRVKTPLSLEDARRLVAEFVTHYNTVRLHSAIAYITPADKLAGRAEAIWAARKQKLATANARRRAKAEKEGFAQSQCSGVTLRRPGRRIGQRGDATRAPTQVPRPERAARCRPTAFRDWPESDKSIHSLCSQFTSLTSDAVFPISAEPTQTTSRRSVDGAADRGESRRPCTGTGSTARREITRDSRSGGSRITWRGSGRRTAAAWARSAGSWRARSPGSARPAAEDPLRQAASDASGLPLPPTGQDLLQDPPEGFLK